MTLIVLNSVMYWSGVGVFAGYYQRQDLTEEVLIDVNGEKCYRTGDLARLDLKSGELIFDGRKDFQIKLRGQRIELSVIESVILQSSSDILSCVVLKETTVNDGYLCAYVKIRENADQKNIEDKMMRNTQKQLPSYMIPAKWIFIYEFPLNRNGKIDREKLSSLNIEVVDSPSRIPLSLLEKKLEDIFIRAFNFKTSPDVLKSFGELGGTSLGAMHALILIRQELFEEMDISLLFSNPSIRQLATVLSDKKSMKTEPEDETTFSVRPTPSWFIETFGVLLLAWQWLWPFFIRGSFNLYFFHLLLIPFIHLLQYPVFNQLLGGSYLRNHDRLYSWRYYRLWFLRHQWSLNRYWLGYLFGTEFYTIYLRLCGARISRTARIYTSQIDAPWLLEIGDSSYISEEVVLSSVSYHDEIYDLHQIRIGCQCSVGKRSVLHDRVDMCDGVWIAPLGSVSGRILGNHLELKVPCKFILSHSIFQLVMILLMLSIHVFIIRLSCYALSICWLSWSVMGVSVSLLFLRYVVGNVEENHSYPLNSWSFIHKFWLRQLILHSFTPCLSNILDELHFLTPLILRWLGASIENNNIQIADFAALLAIPSNLLTMKSDVTTSSEISFIPYDVTVDGVCIVTGRIEINRRVFLGNNCMIQADVKIPDDVLISSLTQVDAMTIMRKG